MTEKTFTVIYVYDYKAGINKDICTFLGMSEHGNTYVWIDHSLIEVVGKCEFLKDVHRLKKIKQEPVVKVYNQANNELFYNGTASNFMELYGKLKKFDKQYTKKKTDYWNKKQ